MHRAPGAVPGGLKVSHCCSFLLVSIVLLSRVMWKRNLHDQTLVHVVDLCFHRQILVVFRLATVQVGRGLKLLHPRAFLLWWALHFPIFFGGDTMSVALQCPKRLLAVRCIKVWFLASFQFPQSPQQSYNSLQGASNHGEIPLSPGAPVNSLRPSAVTHKNLQVCGSCPPYVIFLWSPRWELVVVNRLRVTVGGNPVSAIRQWGLSAKLNIKLQF